MRFRIRSLIAVLTIGLFGRGGEAQCSATGLGCDNTVTKLACSTSPHIGMIWTIKTVHPCKSKLALMAFGVCNKTAFPWPATCRECRKCNVDVFPILWVVSWTGTAGLHLSIPRDPALVGAEFCFQNACDVPASSCACLSNAIRARILR